MQLREKQKVRPIYGVLEKQFRTVSWSAWPSRRPRSPSSSSTSDLSQPLVSWHLRALKAIGLVETRRQGREVICSLRGDEIDRSTTRQRRMLGLAG